MNILLILKKNGLKKTSAEIIQSNVCRRWVLYHINSQPKKNFKKLFGKFNFVLIPLNIFLSSQQPGVLVILTQHFIVNNVEYKKNKKSLQLAGVAI